MNDHNKHGFNLQFVLLIFGVLLIIGLFIRPLLFPILGISIILFLTWVGSALKEKFQNRAHSKTAEGAILQQIKRCEKQIEKHSFEIQDIKINIDDLEKGIDYTYEINEQSQKESERLTKAFKNEMSLRKAKIEFYEVCALKLKTILYNRQLVHKLDEKQRKLSKLQENHYEDLADMESMKTNVEYDKNYLSSIEELSLQMLKSKTLDAAQQLNLELIEITKEVRRL